MKSAVRKATANLSKRNSAGSSFLTPGAESKRQIVYLPYAAQPHPVAANDPRFGMEQAAFADGHKVHPYTTEDDS